MTVWQVRVKRHIRDFEKHSHRQVVASTNGQPCVSAGGGDDEDAKWMAKAFGIASEMPGPLAAILGGSRGKGNRRGKK